SAPGCGTSTALIIFGMAHLHERTEPFDVAVLERVLHLTKGEVEVPTSGTPSPAALPRCACGCPRPGAAVPHRSASPPAPRTGRRVGRAPRPGCPGRGRLPCSRAR